MTITQIAPAEMPDVLDDLAKTLHATVQDGASVGFILPFSHEDARAFWQADVFPRVQTGAAHLFVARRDARVVGTVQLGLGLPANQPHRADVAKMLVHPEHRRRGIARQLMEHVEARARALGKTLLVLDTRSGDAAGKLYTSQGFEIAGEIPGFCRHPAQDLYEATTYMFKPLL
ncbi:MAG: N-acetyltransferase family protein [Sedimentitalea sp.]